MEDPKHYIVRCPECGVVIRQCRCPSYISAKVEIKELCDLHKKSSVDRTFKMATLFSTAASKDIFSMEMPKSKKFDDRIEWAGNKIADAAEGILSDDEGWFIWSTIVGWADLCSEDDRIRYIRLANSISDILKNREESK